MHAAKRIGGVGWLRAKEVVLCRHLVVNLLGFEVQIFPECVERLRFTYGGIEKGIHGGNGSGSVYLF
jgi:hypothetical protein